MVPRRRPSAVPAVALAVLLLAAAGAAGGSPVSDAATAPSVSAGEVAGGDVAEVAVDLPAGTSVELTIAGPEHEATLVVTDRDGDGTVTLRVNTYLDGAAAYGAAGDTVRVEEASGGFAAGTYAIEAGEAGATLAVVEPSATDLTLMRGHPDLAGEVADAGDVEAARAADRLVALDGDDGGELFREDTLVVRLNATGLAGPLAAESGAPVERLATGLARTDANLTARIANPAPQLPTYELRLLDPAATTLVGGNGTYYLVVDLTNVTVESGAGEQELRLGDEFEVVFTHAGPDQAGAVGVDEADHEGDVVAASFVRERPAASFAADTLRLVPGETRTLTGDSTFAPWHDLAVRLAADGTEVVVPATVDADGAFSATVDVPAAADGTEARAVVVDGDGNRYPRGYGEPDGTGALILEPAAAVDLDSDHQVGDGAVLVVGTVETTHGGTLAVYDQDGDLRATRALDPGTEWYVRVGFAEPLSESGPLTVVVYRHAPDPDAAPIDAAADPYESDGEPVTASIEYTVETPTRTDAATPTGTATERPTAIPGTEPPTASPTETDVPGFGIPVAALALALAAALGRRVD